ncbi:MAG: substrate-binding domain-containing protein [Cytophagaceae bacterium]|nr:substrate-binding domain-containing protein [Cytophagaceae bacterium]
MLSIQAASVSVWTGRGAAPLAMNDPTATEALKVIKSRGLRIPEDMAIVGFSNDPIAAVIETGITTVAQPVDEIGQHAARLLLKQLAASDDEHVGVETVVLPTHLVIRGSTVRVR